MRKDGTVTSYATGIAGTQSKQFQRFAYGSGVIIDDNKIITNKHVIENAYFGKVKKYGSESVYSICYKDCLHLQITIYIVIV